VTARKNNGTKEWRCSHRYANCCIQDDWGNTHDNLEIGHKEGFYTHISKAVDTVVVCDGKRHWLVMLYDTVVEANEDMDNLEPQCTKCNRDPRQKSKDDQGGGKYQPEVSGPCPGDTCAETKVSEL
jgi:hypothetical protein